MNKTVGDLAEWIVKHKKNSAFQDNTWADVVAGMQEDIKYNRAIYVYDDNEDDFTGVVTFIIDVSNRLVFIKNILVTKHSALVIFIKYFKMRFAGYNIAGNRGNEYTYYNAWRLCHLLETMKGKQ